MKCCVMWCSGCRSCPLWAVPCSAHPCQGQPLLLCFRVVSSLMWFDPVTCVVPCMIPHVCSIMITSAGLALGARELCRAPLSLQPSCGGRGMLHPRRRVPFAPVSPAVCCRFCSCAVEQNKPKLVCLLGLQGAVLQPWKLLSCVSLASAVPVSQGMPLKCFQLLAAPLKCPAGNLQPIPG